MYADFLRSPSPFSADLTSQILGCITLGGQLPDLSMIALDRDLRVVHSGGAPLPAAWWRNVDLTGHTLDDIAAGQLSETFTRQLHTALDGSYDRFVGRLSVGAPMIVVSEVIPLREPESNTVSGVMWFVRDPTGIVNSEHRTRAAVESLLNAFAIFEAVRDGDGSIIDHRCVYANEEVAADTQLSDEPWEGRLASELFPPSYPPGRAERWNHVIETGEPVSIDVDWEREGSASLGPRLVTFELRIAKLDDGVALAWRDITARREVENELRHHLLHDRLTGLANRQLLLDRLAQGIAGSMRHNSVVAVLFIDLDDFKVVNDSLGHAAGDQLLVMFGERLSSHARIGDTAARLGGDEFVMVLTDLASRELVTQVAERLRRALSEPCRIADIEVHVRASIGIAEFGPPIDPHQAHPESATLQRMAEALLHDADLAMYNAKQHGKNRIELYDAALRERAARRMWTESSLRRALRSGNEITVHYQPIMELGNNSVEGFEALVRWNDPDLGWQLPKSFLAVAEASGLIAEVGDFVFRTACAQLAIWQAERPLLSMNINLSLRQLSQADLADRIGEVLAETHVDAKSLRMEVTETVLMGAGGMHARQLHALADMGVQLGIDDFGTGYASLTYLKRFPVQFVKVDQSFVSGLGERQDDTAIVDAVIRLGRALRLDTIAEGIETAEQLAMVKRLGATHAQGFLIARPQPADELAWLVGP